MLPKISIIVPNYNLDRFLERTLRSIIDQPYENKEIIIVDGASTDKSVDIIRKYESHFAKVIIEKDTGQSNALNKGFAAATGDVLCWTNSDDILMPNALNVVGSIFSKMPEVHWIVGNTTLIAENDVVLRSVRPRSHSRIRFLSGDYRWLQQESSFWSRELWETAGGRVDETFSLAMDAELWLRMFQHARCYPVESALGAFRLRAGQRSAQFREKYITQVEQAGTLARRNLSEGYRKFFKEILDQPFTSRTSGEADKLGPKISAEDLQPITFNDTTGEYVNPNKGNFSPHLKKTISAPKDIISTLDPSVFLRHRFGTAGDDLSAFRNRHAGERCFVMGNGPSLKQMDLSVFANETVLASNSIFLLYDKIAWRPKYYACVDTRVLPDIRADLVKVIDQTPGTTYFLPSELHVWDGTGRTMDTRKLVAKKPNVHFFRQRYIDRDKLPAGAFSEDANDALVVPNTVTITLMQLAAYMGFSEIVLIGCDTSYVIPKTVERSGPENGDKQLLLTSTEDDDPNHFDPRYFGKGRAWHNPRVEDMIWHYEQAKAVLDARKIRVYNATVGGALEVFERRDYRTLAGPGSQRPAKAG